MRNKTRKENNTQLNNFSTQIFLKVPFCRIVIMRAQASDANASAKTENRETQKLRQI